MLAHLAPRHARWLRPTYGLGFCWGPSPGVRGRAGAERGLKPRQEQPLTELPLGFVGPLAPECEAVRERNAASSSSASSSFVFVFAWVWSTGPSRVTRTRGANGSRSRSEPLGAGLDRQKRLFWQDAREFCVFQH